MPRHADVCVFKYSVFNSVRRVSTCSVLRTSSLGSAKDSRAQLDEIIKAWSEVRDLELFFAGVEAAARTLSDEGRGRVISRLALARKFVGTQNPMDFFLGWKTPRERYRRRFKSDGSEVTETGEEE